MILRITDPPSNRLIPETVWWWTVLWSGSSVVYAKEISSTRLSKNSKSTYVCFIAYSSTGDVTTVWWAFVICECYDNLVDNIHSNITGELKTVYVGSSQ